ncbi:hypothetical protein KTH_31590 [Thermosporothrix hazakensis]|jgi:serine/threonine protein kinase/Tfp pilus assembly protein PilF|nr:hypothetical protein KTC_48200 [Thermosporothrix sp. COM3]GCE48290.1 hypothetical protein KTH_31590 [Thermosporothrix hazakensis]
MGTVYKVAQVGTNPPYYYAVKELLVNPNTSEEERNAAIDRFHKEIELLRDLKHPRIASLKLPFQDRGNYYFAMEFVPGRSLEKILEDANKPLPEEQVIKWMIQVCEALSYIHSRVPPIILRDLKPGNIMITPDNEVQLIDFGIARRFDPNKRTNTENLGTISYASPEHLGSITMPGQRRSADNPGRLVQTDARSDIYSLGATMYHLLTNYEPEPIQTPAPGSILAKNPALRTIQVGGKTVCPVEQVIIKAMQQEPAHRFQNADAMRTALFSCLPNVPFTPTTVQIPSMPNKATISTTPAGSAVSGLICPKCGYQNRIGAKFCKRDGQPLVQGVAVAPPQQRHSRIQARPVRQPIQPRPVARQPIRARPVSSNNAARPATSMGDPMQPYRDGLQQLASKNYAGAVSHFKQALSLGAPPYDTYYNLGRSYRQYGQAVRSINQKAFTDNMRYAAEQFEQALKYKADGIDAHFQLGLCYRDLGLLEKASAAFQKARSLAPQDPAIYYQLGSIALEQGMKRNAETWFQDGLQINPNHVLLLSALGRLQLEEKQIPAAIKTLQQATRLDPSLWDAWYALGRAHMHNREWKYALGALERSRQANPRISETYSALATAYLKLNKKHEARKMVEEALAHDPQNTEARRLQKQL